MLKQDGILSIVKHNRPGRVMQMAVLLDDFEKANALLDGKNAGKREENDNSKTEKTAVSEKGEKRSDKENC